MFKNSGKTHEKTILWGAPGSGFSGRTRSYLRKKGLVYQEIFPSHRRFHEEIVPLIGYFVMPVTELTDGTLIQDSTDTVVYFENEYPENPLIPSTPVQKAIAWLLGFFGSETLLKAAMHYRWSFVEEDRPFTEATFGHFFSAHRDREKQRQDVVPLMEYFDGFLGDLGVTPETIPVIEASHKDLLDVLNVHFLQCPYLLGGRPSLADFGLMVPMYAHLSRDPVACTLMKLHAPQVFRWTERMNEPGIVDGEFPDAAPEYPANDTLPETLLPILKYFFTDCGPEMLGMIATFNAWCEANPNVPSGAAIQTDADQVGAHPRLGKLSYELRGVAFHRQTFTSALYHFQRVQDVIAGLDRDGRSALNDIVEKAGGQELISATLTRRIKSEHYRYALA